MRLLWVIASLFWAGAVQAQLFKIENRQGAPNAVFDALEARINAELPQVDSGEEYLDATANAVAFSGRGTAVDYNSTPKRFSIHAAVGGAVVSELGLFDALDISDDKLKNADIRGVGASGAISVGINMGFLGRRKETVKKRSVKKPNGDLAVQTVKEKSGFDWNRLTTYLKFMTLDRDFGGVAMKTTQFGLAAKYKLLRGKNLGSSQLAKWSGLDVSVGVDHGRFDLATTYEISESVTDSNSGLTGTYNGQFDVGAEIKTTVLSAEVWTGVRLLHALGLYGGVGFDSVSGSSRAETSSTGNVSFTGGASGDGVLVFGSDGRPDGVHIRAFLGTQIHIFPVKLFAQWNAAVSPNKLKGITAGARFVF